MVGWHRRLDGHEFAQTREIVKDREPGVLQSVAQRVGHDLASEQQYRHIDIPYISPYMYEYLCTNCRNC